VAAPTPSALDYSQCIQGAYDESKGRLRTTGEATIVNGAIEVAISASTDNIAIRNTSNGYELLINSDGSINCTANFSGSVSIGTPDNSVFTYSASSEQTVGGVFNDTATTVSSGNAGAARITQYRAIHTNLRDNSGNEINSGNPLGVSATSLPLPTGASTSALQTTGNASLSSIDTKLTSPLTVTGPLTDAQLRASDVPVSAASLPLPSGAATSANQTTEITALGTINTTLGSPFQSGGSIGNTSFIATQATGTNLHTVVDSGTITSITNSVAVTAVALPLPSGASTSANQDTEIASLSSIDTKTPALGQALAAASTPVVLTAAQISTLTPLSSVTVNNGAAGSAVNIQDGGNSITIDGTVAISGTVPVSGTVAATQSGTWTVQPGNTANTTAWKVDGSAVTQPVSGTFFQATQPVSIAATVAVSGPLTDTQLRATPVPVSGTVTANAGSGTFAVSAASLPLPSGAATSALQTQPGVDIGDVTVNNASGGSAVNIQDGGNSITVDGTVAISGTTPVSLIEGVVSSVNSTTANLGANATFTGTAEDVIQYSAICVFVGVDRAGVLNGESSTDGTNWDKIESFTVTPTSPGTVQGFFFQLQCHAKYFRNRYVNDGTAQGVFRLQTIYKVASGTAEVQNVSVPMLATTDALTTKGVIYGVTTGGGGGYVAVKVNPSGALTAEVTQSGTWNITNVSGTISLPTGAATSALQTQPGVDIGDVTVNNAAGVAAVNIQDGGNSITVDGTFFQATQPVSIASSVPVTGPLTDAELRATAVPISGTVTADAGSGTFAISAAALPLPSGAATSALQTQPGVDIGDVTVNNGAAGAAVNIQDGGNSITVDGTFFQATQPVSIAASVAVTGPLTDVELRASAVPISAAALPLPSGAATSALQTQPGVDIGDVTVNNASGGSAVNIQDGGNSITVDGTVAISGTTPVSTIEGVVSSVNSTTANLGGNATFTGTGEDVTQYSSIYVFVRSDTVILVSGQTSNDNTNWYTLDAVQTSVASGDSFFWPCRSKYFRITALNSATPQTIMNLQTVYRVQPYGIPLVRAESSSVGLDGIWVMGKATTVAPTYANAAVDALSLTTAGSLRTAVTTSALPTGASTAALQTQPGVDIGDVTVNNAAGASAVNIQDGGNSITVDDGGGAITVDGSITFLNSAINIRDTFGSNISVGQQAMVGSLGVVIASNQTAVPVSGTGTFDVSAASLPLPALAATSTKQSDGTQKTQLVDGAGLVYGPAIVSGGENSMPVAQSATNFVFSTVNTSAVQLASGATFTGTVESAVNQQSYSILLFSDQPGTLSILQYIDAGGTKLIQTITINNLVNVPIVRSGVINGNYIKVTYQNTGLSATTTFTLDTAFGTIPSATQLNNGPVSLQEVNGTAISLGQTTMVASLPVTIASNQAAFPVSISTSDPTLDLLKSILVELQTMKLAMVMMATEGRRANPIDFNIDGKNQDINYLNS